MKTSSELLLPEVRMYLKILYQLLVFRSIFSAIPFTFSIQPKGYDAIYSMDESPPDRTGRDCDATRDVIKIPGWYSNKSLLTTSE